MLNKDGEIIDDVVILRVDEDKYWVSTLYGSKMDDWWYHNGADYDVEGVKLRMSGKCMLYRVQNLRSY